MNIQEAMKGTGKARIQYGYVMLNNSVLVWYYNVHNKQQGAVSLEDILRDDWQSYHPIEEIRPKEAGELWLLGDNGYHMTTNRQNASFVNVYGVYVGLSGVIHNQNGWTRLCPEVPNENKIVIEGTTLGIEGRKVYIKEWDKICRLEILGKLAMTMILIPEDSDV